jgi:hypothetical protein
MTDSAIPDTFSPKSIEHAAKATSVFNAQGANDERHHYIFPRHRLRANAR